MEEEKSAGNPNIDYTNVMANKEAYFSPEQVQAIINYWYDKEAYDKALFFFTLYRTGRRVSEVLGKPPFAVGRKTTMSNYKGLRPIDLLDKQRLVHFEILKKNYIRQKTKSGQKRDEETLIRLYYKKQPKKVLLPIDDELYDLLKWYQDKYAIQDNDRFFQFSRFSANLFLKEACDKTNIKLNLGNKRIKLRSTHEIVEVRVQPHLHMFRHTYAIHLLKRNQNNPTALPSLKKLLQHSRMEITEHYLQFSQEDTRELLNKTWIGDD